MGFIVVSGKYEHDGSRNFKYISEEFPTLAQAKKEWDLNKSYHFNEIELHDADGNVYILNDFEQKEQ